MKRSSGASNMKIAARRTRSPESRVKNCVDCCLARQWRVAGSLLKKSSLYSGRLPTRPLQRLGHPGFEAFSWHWRLQGPSDCRIGSGFCEKQQTKSVAPDSPAVRTSRTPVIWTGCCRNSIEHGYADRSNFKRPAPSGVNATPSPRRAEPSDSSVRPRNRGESLPPMPAPQESHSRCA